MKLLNLVSSMPGFLKRRPDNRVQPNPEFGMSDILELLVAIADRFPREYDENYKALVRRLHAFRAQGDEALGEFSGIWAEFSDAIHSTPQWFDLLFPETCKETPELLDRIRKAGSRRYLPVELQTGTGSADNRLRDQTNSEGPAGLTRQLLHELATGDPGKGAPFVFLSKFYFFRDISYGYFVNTNLRPLQKAIFQQCYLQRHNWKFSYASDYPYQGIVKLGIGGIKPTEERLARYDIAGYLRRTDQVLDIGANNGCLALVIAEMVAHVDGIEYNPYLVTIANIAADFLRIRNASFLVGDFVEFESTKQYDAIFSLANHCTIDGNLSVDFEEYIAKCFSMLRPNGYLFFESHNVFGPGKGRAGDDGDLDAKFDVVERYFEVVKSKMIRAYVPAFDVDKLFVVLRRRESYQANVQRSFSLSEARLRYAY
jgi:SAM-dependent methyltransferase